MSTGRYTYAGCRPAGVSVLVVDRPVYLCWLSACVPAARLQLPSLCRRSEAAPRSAAATRAPPAAAGGGPRRLRPAADRGRRPRQSGRPLYVQHTAAIGVWPQSGLRHRADQPSGNRRPDRPNHHPHSCSCPRPGPRSCCCPCSCPSRRRRRWAGQEALLEGPLTEACRDGWRLL